MRFWTLAVLITFHFNLCYTQTYIPAGLKKLNAEERIRFIKTGIYPTSATRYKNTSGSIAENRHTLDPTDFFYDYYVNDKNEIVECIIRKRTKEDNVLWKRMIDTLQARDWGTIIPAKVMCAGQTGILKDILIKDQKDRIAGQPVNRETDKKNLEKVLGIIESCGFPAAKTVGQDGMKAVFLVLQHSTRKMLEMYLPLIKQSAVNGDINLREVAMMEDRLLMESGEKQKYGTQVVSDDNGQWKLHPVEDPVNVNQRRKAMGLESIEDFLKKSKIGS